MARRRHGSVAFVDEGRYQVFWYENGRRRSKRIHATREEAEAFLARMQSGMGSILDCTYDDYWEKYVVPTFDGLSQKTVYGYRQVWRHDLQPAIGSRMVGATEWRMVQDVLGGIESPSVQRAAYRLWSKICNLAARDGIIDRNPVDRNIRLRPLRKRRRELYSPEEVLEVLDAYKGKYRYLLVLELCAGLRHEEACAVTADDVRYEDGYAVVSVSKALIAVDGRKVLKETKTAFSEREVVLGEPFCSALRDCWMPRNEAETVRPTTATHNWRAWCCEHDVKYVPFGTMRSNFATIACECCDSSLVSLYMGHSDGTTRGRNYQQSTARGMRIVADSMSGYYANLDYPAPLHKG